MAGGGGSWAGRGSLGQAETGRRLRRCWATGAHSTAGPACSPACSPACTSLARPGGRKGLGWAGRPWHWDLLGRCWWSGGVSLPALGAGNGAPGTLHRVRGAGSSWVQQVRQHRDFNGRQNLCALQCLQILPSALRCGLSPALQLWEVGELSCVVVCAFTLKPNEFTGGLLECAVLTLPCVAGPGGTAGMELKEAVFKGQKRSKAHAGARCCTQGRGVPGSSPVPDQHTVAPALTGTGLSQPLCSGAFCKTRVQEAGAAACCSPCLSPQECPPACPLRSSTARVRRAPAAAETVTFLPTSSSLAPGWLVSGDRASSVLSQLCFALPGPNLPAKGCLAEDQQMG